MIDFDFTDSTLTKQAATKKMREIVLSELVECFRTKYGDEAVSIVGNNEISVGRFTIKDSDDIAVVAPFKPQKEVLL